MWIALAVLSATGPAARAEDEAAGAPPAPTGSAPREVTVIPESSSFGLFTTTATTLYPTLAPTITTRERKQRAARQRAQLDYVRANGARLVEEMAEGGGQHLALLAELMGCPWAWRPDFFRMVQRRFAVIVPGVELAPEALLARLRTEIAADGEMEGVCRWV